MENTKYKIKVFKLNEKQVFVSVSLNFYNSPEIYKIKNLRFTLQISTIRNDCCCLPNSGASIMLYDGNIHEYLNSLINNSTKLLEENVLEIQYTDLCEKIQDAEYILFNKRNDCMYFFKKDNNVFVSNNLNKLRKKHIEDGTVKAFNI